MLNHTANESAWLQDHPEVTYNCSNCPYLRPAYLLDAALHQFSLDVAKGLYEDRGIPPWVNNEDHLNAIRYHLNSDVIPKLKIPEMYTANVTKLVAEFSDLSRNNIKPNESSQHDAEDLVLIQDPQYRRLGTGVDMKVALKLYNIYRHDSYDEDTRIQRCVDEFKKRLDLLNNSKIEEINQHLNAAVENCVAGIRYFRVQSDGPRIKTVTAKDPLVARYFTDVGKPANVKEHEDLMYGKEGAFLMAHNGWVMNADPFKNFAASGSNVYIRRELIAWGDSVKLR